MNPPAPSTIASAAPNPAAEEIPSVNGDASGFLTETCVAEPASANPAPAKTATNALGSLISQMIASRLPPLLFMSLAITSKGGIYEEPTQSDKVKAKIRQKKSKEMSADLLCDSFLYCVTMGSVNGTSLPMV